MSTPRPSQSFLLRCSPFTVLDGRVKQHFMLVHIQSGERRGFGDLDALFAFLREQIEAGRGHDKGTMPDPI